MADVTKIKLPDNSTVNIKDYRIPGVDTTPTSGSDNLVTSGGVYKDIEDASRVTSAALNDLNDRLTTVEDGGDWVTTEEFHQLEGVAKDTYTMEEIDALFDDLDEQYISVETDPTVPAWAKAPNKPTYTASEVGALSSSTIIPTKVSDLTNDSNFTTKTYVDAIKYASSKSVGGPADKAVSIPFATVAGTSTATAFTATIDGITELRDGICFYLRNNKITSASGWTLNVNGLGAKPVYLSDSSSTRCTTQFENNGYYLFIYNTARVQDGCFDLCQLFDTNTTYTNASLGHGYGTCSTAYGTAAKAVTCSGYLLTTGGYITVNFTNDVDANATLNVNSKGAKAIYYQGAAIGDKVIKAGDTALFIYNTYYYLVSIDRGGGTGTVTSVNVGSTAYIPTNGVVSLPAYPTTLPASDVSAWAKASTKPTYTANEVGALPNTTVIPAAPGTLTTTSTTALSTATNEALSGSISLHKVAKTGTYNDLIGKPTIPAAVTESTVAGWGFTKNTGTLTTETDPVFTASTAASITSADVSAWNGKQDAISDLSDIRSGAALGATALQSYTETDPTVPSWAKAASKPTYTASEVGALPDTTSIPTESTVSGWGFTKNTGTYSKPSGGIPATDLASAVQTSLGKADTALQSYTETDPTVPSWAKASSKPTYTASEVGALPDTTVIPAAPGTLKTNATTAQTASASEALSGTITLHKIAKTGTYSDLIGTPTIPTKVSDLTNDSNFTSNTGTVTGVKINGTTKTPTSGTVDLGTVLTSETALSKGTTTGSGNAVTDVSVSGHTITLTKGSTFLTSETSLSKGTTTGSGNVVTDLSVSGHTITLTKGSTVPVATSANAGKIPRITSVGAWEYVTPAQIYSGSAAPNNSNGNNGDIYVQT